MSMRPLTMQKRAALHRVATEDRCDFEQRFGIVVRVEAGEFVREDREENDAS